MRNQWRQRVNCVSQQPTSHASVSRVFKGQTEHLKPLIHLPVHVIPLDKILRPFTVILFRKESYAMAKFLELYPRENNSPQTSATVWFCAEINPAAGVIVDGAGRCLTCIGVGNYICDGFVPHTLHHLSVWLLEHTDMSLLRGEGEQQGARGAGCAGAVDYLSSRWRNCHKGVTEWGAGLGFCDPAYGEKRDIWCMGGWGCRTKRKDASEAAPVENKLWVLGK